MTLPATMAALLGFGTILGQMAFFSTVEARLPSNLLSPPQAGQHARIPGHLGLEF